MALPTGLNRSRSAVVFLVNETTAGLIAANPVAADTFGLTTVPVIGQSGNYTDTSEIGAELISVDRVLNYMEYSTFDFEYYAKPGGWDDTDVSTNLDGVTPIANAAGTVTISYATAGDNVLVEGDTITIVTDDSAANGTFVITGSTGTDATYQLTTANAGAAPSSITSIVKKNYDFASTPEHDLLIRTFGGVKYMSAGSNGNNSAYYAGETPASGPAAPAEGNATIAQYFLKNTVQTFTVTSRQFTDSSIQMYTATGSLPTNFSVSLSKDGPVTFSSSFQANRVLYGGTATVDNSVQVAWDANGGANDSREITITSPKRYYNATVVAEDVAWYHSDSSIGMKVKLMSGTTQYPSSDTNAMVITAVSGDKVTVQNLDSNSVTMTTSGEWYLIPWSPVPCPDTGGILDQRKVQVFISDAPAFDEETSKIFDYAPGTTEYNKLFNSVNALDVTSVNFDFDRSISTPALTEMTGEEFPPASYIINEPTVSGSMTLLLRPKDFQYMNSLREEPRRSIGVRVGLTDGRIIEMAIASAFMEIPSPSDADGATQIDIPFTAVRGVECQDADKFMIRYR